MQQNDRLACCRAALLVADRQRRGADRLHGATSRKPARPQPSSADHLLTVSTSTDLVIPSPPCRATIGGRIAVRRRGGKGPDPLAGSAGASSWLRKLAYVLRLSLWYP